LISKICFDDGENGINLPADILLANNTLQAQIDLPLKRRNPFALKRAQRW
jgi:hypothetical protein